MWKIWVPAGHVVALPQTVATLNLTPVQVVVCEDQLLFKNWATIFGKL